MTPPSASSPRRRPDLPTAPYDAGPPGAGDDRVKPGWTFLTNHAHVLLCIAADPEIRQRDIAFRVGITERAAQKIVSELEEGGYVVRQRVGRRNRYEVDAAVALRHPMEARHTIGELLGLLTPPLPRR